MEKPSNRRVQASPFTRREIEEAVENWFQVCQVRRDRELLARIVSRDLAGWPSGDDRPAFLDTGKDPDEDQPNALSEMGAIIANHFWLADTSLTEDEWYSLLEKVDMLELGWRHAAWDTFSSANAPLYSLKEHSAFINRLCDLLQWSRQTHIETGMPPVLGGFPRQLEPLLRLYYTRIPEEARLGEKMLAGIGRSLTRRSLRNPLGEPEVIDRKHGIAIEYKWPEGNIRHGDPIRLQGFDLHDIVKLEEGRAAFYELKMEVLQILWAELQRDRPRPLWVRCLPAFTDHILHPTYRYLLKTDAVYLYYSFPDNPAGRLFPILFNADEKVPTRTMMTSDGQEVTMGNKATWEQCTAGGLSDLIELICFYDFESKVGGWTKARDKLESLVVDSQSSCLPILYGACKSSRRVNIDDYRDLILGEKGGQLCDAYRKLCEALPKWRAFREDFMETVRKDLEWGLDVEAPTLRLPRGLYSQNEYEIKKNLRSLRRSIEEHGEVSAELNSRQKEKIHAETTPVYSLKSPHTFYDIKLRLLEDENFIHLYTPGQTKGRRVSYAEFGMAHNRTGKPTKQWILFVNCVENNGKLPQLPKGSKKDKNQMKSVKHRMKNKLRAAFDTTEDPFVLLDGGIGYQLKCRILTKRHTDPIRLQSDIQVDIEAVDGKQKLPYGPPKNTRHRENDE